MKRVGQYIMISIYFSLATQKSVFASESRGFLSPLHQSFGTYRKTIVLRGGSEDLMPIDGDSHRDLEYAKYAPKQQESSKHSAPSEKTIVADDETRRLVESTWSQLEEVEQSLRSAALEAAGQSSLRKP